MKRYALLAPLCSAVFALLLAAAPAQAASVHSSAPLHAVAPQAMAAHFGSRCFTVHSSPNNRTGTICILINNHDVICVSDPKNCAAQSLATFSIKSGSIKKVCVNHENLLQEGKTVRSVNFKCKWGGGTRNFIGTAFWIVTPRFSRVQGRVYKPCIYWRDGTACISGRWLYSGVVAGL